MAEILEDEEQAEEVEDAYQTETRLLRAPWNFWNQHERLENEPRLDAGRLTNPIGAMPLRETYGGVKRWKAQATVAELHRWCRRHWDYQTDAVGEARYRKASRPDQPLPLDAVIGYSEDDQPTTAEDLAAYQRWQGEQRAEDEQPRWTAADWGRFWASLTEDERITLQLLAGELPDGGYGPFRTGREVARMLGVNERMIRKRRQNAERKLALTGIEYKTRESKSVMRGRYAPHLYIGNRVDPVPAFSFARMNSIQGRIPA